MGNSLLVPDIPHLRTLHGPNVARSHVINLPPSVGYADCFAALLAVFAHHDVLNAAVRTCEDDFRAGHTFVRFVFFKAETCPEARLLAILDHIVFDAYGLEIIIGDVRTALSQAARGNPIELVPTTSYYAYWTMVQDYLMSNLAERHREFWRTLNWDRVATLPPDYSRGHQSFGWRWDHNQRRAVPHWDHKFRDAVVIRVDQSTSDAVLRAGSGAAARIERLVAALLLAQQEYYGVYDKPLSMSFIVNKRIGVVDMDTSRTVGNFAGRCHVVFDCAHGQEPSAMVSLVHSTMSKLPYDGKTQDALFHFESGQFQYRLSGMAFNYIGTSEGSNQPSAMRNETVDESLLGMTRWPEYQVDGLTPGCEYLVRLHFLEPEYDQPGRRYFDIWLNCRPVLSKFDIVRDAGSRDTVAIKEFWCTASDAGRIDINLVSYNTAEGSAVISAFEILQATSDQLKPVARINAGSDSCIDWFEADRFRSGGEPVTVNTSAVTSGVQGAAPQAVYASASACPRMTNQPHLPAIMFRCGLCNGCLEFYIEFATNLYKLETIHALADLVGSKLRLVSVSREIDTAEKEY